MSADRVFVDALVVAIQARGGVIMTMPDNPTPNPFPFVFTLDGDEFRLLVYVRKTTPQHGIGTDHGRPHGEWHTQMIFDDSVRGSGVRNRLKTRDNFRTVLFGYVETEKGIVIVAWDPSTKAEYGYSRSLQVRDDALVDALRVGLAKRETRRGDEVVLAFRPEQLPEYLRRFREFHNDVPRRE